MANASNYSLSILISESHGSVFFPCFLYAFNHFVLYVPHCCTYNWIIPLFLFHIISMLMETICAIRLQVLTVIFLSVTPCAFTVVLGGYAVCISGWRIWNWQSIESSFQEPFKALCNIYLVIQRKMPWVMLSAVGLGPERSRFDMRPVCMSLLVGKGALRTGSSPSTSVLPHQYHSTDASYPFNRLSAVVYSLVPCSVFKQHI